MAIGYAIKEGIRGMGRAKLASFTSTFSLFIAVLLLGMLARGAYNIYDLSLTLKKAIEIEVFLQNVNEISIKNIGNTIAENPYVSSVDYISKDSAKTIFLQDFGTENNPLVDIDFLPASYKVKLKDAATVQGVDDLIATIKPLPGVDEIRFNRQLMEILETRFQTFVLAGTIISALIALAAIILIFNTIRLTIYAKRNLIRAMKLIGATNSFIRRPFIYEGFIQGIIAGILSVFTLAIFFSHILPALIPQFAVLKWPLDQWYYLSGAMIVFAIVLAWAGSRWAARKFLQDQLQERSI